VTLEGTVNDALASTQEPLLAKASGQTRRTRELAVILSFVTLLIAFTYFFIGSAGHLKTWPSYTSYYDEQAEAFRHGQLNLLNGPAPELLAQANPYDPKFSRFWRFDLSLYKGKYFTYWGPVPALLQAGVKTVLGIHGRIGDQYLAGASLLLCAVAGAFLVFGMARRLFPDLPVLLAGLGALGFACANPAPFLVATGGVYQAAIAAGQGFMLLGLVFAFNAVWRSANSLPFQKYLVAAGTLWALAFGSRITLAPTVGLFVVATVLATRRSKGHWGRPFVVSLLSVGTPVVLGGGALLFYNWLRFDNWLEFGMGKAVTLLPYSVSADYLGINFYSYLFRQPTLSCEFPFISAPSGGDAMTAPSPIHVPSGYMSEPLVGLLSTGPGILFGAVAIVTSITSLRAMRLRGKTLMPIGLGARSRLYLWCAFCFTVCGTVSGAGWYALFLASMRYLADISFGLGLLGLLGGWTLWSSLRQGSWPHRITSIALLASSAVTIAAGLLLGYQGYNRHFRSFNPQLDAYATRTFSVCEPIRP